MQHGTGAFHNTQDRNCEDEPHEEGDDKHEDLHRASHAESVTQCHTPEHNGKLLMSQRERPKSEVGGSVGDAVETEFNGI